MIADAEKLIGNYLRTYPGLGVRVVGQPPPQELLGTPWIMLTQLDADNEAAVTPDYLITYFLQLDCYAGEDGGQPEAISVGRKARDALADLNGRGSVLGGTYVAAAGTIPAHIDGGPAAVVSSVRFTSHARVPDTGFEPARERIVLDAEITMHRAGTIDT